MKFAHVRTSEHFTFAKQIFLSKAISLARRANLVGWITTKKTTKPKLGFFFRDPDENRTRVTAVKGRCLIRLTTGPLVAEGGFEPPTPRV